MENNYLELMQIQKEKEEIALITASNDISARFGLSLSVDQAKRIIEARNTSLKENGRVEFGKGIIDKIIFYFCDSQYINQDNYEETLIEIQDVFYLFKNELMDGVSDDELLKIMREKFEDDCEGDVEYLADTCMERFAREVREDFIGYLKRSRRRQSGEKEV